MPENAWKNRITELRSINASELMGHDGNWRVHPQHQVDAMAGVLGEVGIVDALLVYDSERQGGLTIIDGHLRRDLRADAEWPCLMTNLDDTEADYVLATFDWLTYQAQADRKALDALLRDMATQDAAVQALLDKMQSQFLSEIKLPDENIHDETVQKSESLIEIRCSQATFQKIHATLSEWDLLYDDFEIDIS